MHSRVGFCDLRDSLTHDSRNIGISKLGAKQLFSANPLPLTEQPTNIAQFSLPTFYASYFTNTSSLHLPRSSQKQCSGRDKYPNFLNRQAKRYTDL